MPRTFWYHCVTAGALAAAVSLLAAGRTTYEENLLYPVFSGAPRFPSFAGVILTLALILAVGHLCMRITGTARSVSFAASYALALFVPFVFLAARFWLATLTVLLLVLSLNELLATESDTKKAFTSALFLSLAVLTSRSVLIAFVIFPLYPSLKKKAARTVLFVGTFAILTLIFEMLSFVPGVAGGGYHFFEGLPFLPSNPYTRRGLIAAFRSSMELRLLILYLPFLLISFAALTVKELSIDKSAVLPTTLLAAVMFPMLLASQTNRAHLMTLFMATYVLFTIAALVGLKLLLEIADSRRSIYWGLMLGFLYLMPALFSLL
jgi:hypothetical protein